jgi:hypothetical protein
LPLVLLLLLVLQLLMMVLTRRKMAMTKAAPQSCKEAACELQTLLSQAMLAR